MSSPSPEPVSRPSGPAHAATAAVATTPLLLLLGWVAARALMVVVYSSTDFAGRSLAWGDLALYEFWAEQIRGTGAMPDGVTWMYPPLAAFVLLLADALPGPFGTVWVILMLLADLAVLLLLAAAVRRDRAHPAGAWAWVALVPLLGLISWARLDLVPVAATAAALLVAVRRPLLAGALAALGTAAKGWPVLLGLLFPRQRRWLLGAVATGVAVAALSTLLLRDTWAFVVNLSGRGVQVESVMALPWTLQQALGTPIEGDFVNGTYEILEPGASTVARASTVLVVLAVGAALWLSRHRAPALRWYAAVAALLATSPLLSTQFILWLIGGAAVAAALPGPDGRVARLTLPLVTVLVALTHLTFPLQWNGLVNDGVLAASTLLSRNVLLLGLTGWLLVAVRGGGPDPADGGSGNGAEHVDQDPALHQRGTDSPASSRSSR